MDAIIKLYSCNLQMIDGGSLRVGYSSATLKIHPDRYLGRSLSGLTIKINAMIGELLLTVKLVVTLGQKHEIKAARLDKSYD
jgi:hypothetical protein